MPLAVTTGQALDVVLAVFLVVVGLAIGYAFWKLGVLLSQLRRTVRNTEREVLPVIGKTGGTIDRVNSQLDTLDAAHLGRDAAADAVLPRPRAAAGAAADHVSEGLPHTGHRRGRPRHLPPHLLRDARQLLVRGVLQGRRGRVCLGVPVRPHED